MRARSPSPCAWGPFSRSSHLPLHLWLQVIHLMCASKKGISTRQIQRMLQCSMKTAWFLGHRIREVMAAKHDMFTPPLGGAGKTVEVDETLIMRDGGKKLGGPGPAFPVMSLLERDGYVRSLHLPNVSHLTLQHMVARHVSPESRLMTDDHFAYRGIGWNFADPWPDHSPEPRIRFQARPDHPQQHRGRLFLDPEARDRRDLPSRLGSPFGPVSLGI